LIVDLEISTNGGLIENSKGMDRRIKKSITQVSYVKQTRILQHGRGAHSDDGV
jgi:hypothetical protein